MPDYCVTISTKINVTTYVTADDEEAAADAGWVLAQEYAHTVVGDQAVVAEVDFDGVGADEVYEVDKGAADVFQRTRRTLSRPHVPVVGPALCKHGRERCACLPNYGATA